MEGTSISRLATVGRCNGLVGGERPRSRPVDLLRTLRGAQHVGGERGSDGQRRGDISVSPTRSKENTETHHPRGDVPLSPRRQDVTGGARACDGAQ